MTHQLLAPLIGHADTVSLSICPSLLSLRFGAWPILRTTYSWPPPVLMAPCDCGRSALLLSRAGPQVSTGLPVMILPRNHANWVRDLSKKASKRDKKMVSLEFHLSFSRFGVWPGRRMEADWRLEARRLPPSRLGRGSDARILVWDAQEAGTWNASHMQSKNL